MVSARFEQFTRRFQTIITDTRIFGLASEAAFWLFFSIVPVLSIVGTLLSRWSLANDEIHRALLMALPQSVRGVARSELKQLAEGSTSLTVGSLLFLWSASTGFHEIRIWMPRPEGRGGKMRRWRERAIRQSSTTW